MSTRTTALALSRLADESAAWTLLRATSAPVAIAILEEHLGGDQRRIPAPELIEMIEIDLDDLRDQGFDLPRRAQAYCAEWRSAGFLVLRPTDETRTETYELSPAALSAIRYIRQLAEPRATVTQSRLATIASRLEDLARDSDPEVTSRLAALRSQRDRIDAEITRISAGDVPAVDPESAAERARDIVDLARGLPDDFAQVRADLELLNRNLRARIVEDDKTQGHVLDEIFRGVDILGESDAGRSFAAF